MKESVDAVLLAWKCIAKAVCVEWSEIVLQQESRGFYSHPRPSCGSVSMLFVNFWKFFFLRWCTGATWRVQRGWKITGPCHKTGSSLSTKEKDRQTSAKLQPKSINSCTVVLCSLLSLSCEFAVIFSFGYLEFSQFLPQFVFWFWSFFFPEMTLINPGTFYELVFLRAHRFLFFLLYFFLKSMLDCQSKRNEITKELC